MLPPDVTIYAGYEFLLSRHFKNAVVPVPDVVVVKVTLLLPSNDTEPVTSPVKVIVLASFHLLAVSALPIRLPVNFELTMPKL